MTSKTERNALTLTRRPITPLSSGKHFHLVILTDYFHLNKPPAALLRSLVAASPPSLPAACSVVGSPVS